ncbi:MAG: two-component system sensor histidine kinase ChvG [Polyangiales bacterium]
MLRQLGRIRARLLIVNLVVVLVPVAGLEFADLYEQQLLGGLERDMRDQAILVRRFLEASVREDGELGHESHQTALQLAAARTRTRVRVFDKDRQLILDSHRDGPPEGPEPEVWGSVLSPVSSYTSEIEAHAPWPSPTERIEVREAFAGQPSSYTRIRNRHPAVLLFVAEPIIPQRRVVGVVYVVRSTVPVIAELHRIRRGLYLLTAAAFLFTLLVTLALAWSISRPLSRLSKAAKRIADGERDVRVPIEGAGEVRALGESFSTMTDELHRRLRFASEFAADVAHEFKSPLTSIRGAAELLSEGAADEPAAREKFLSNILLDVARLDRLVSRLLELGRIEAAGTETARNMVVVAKLVEGLGTRYPTLVVHPVERAPIIHGRQADLSRALMNLLENALRFSPEPGTVELTVKREGSKVFFIVDDAGPGVPTSDQERVFSRFFTTESAVEGTGLGLAIVRAVAEAHGGTASVTSSPAGGARFVFSISARTAS